MVLHQISLCASCWKYMDYSGFWIWPKITLFRIFLSWILYRIILGSPHLLLTGCLVISFITDMTRLLFLVLLTDLLTDILTDSLWFPYYSLYDFLDNCMCNSLCDLACHSLCDFWCTQLEHLYTPLRINPKGTHSHWGIPLIGPTIIGPYPNRVLL